MDPSAPELPPALLEGMSLTSDEAHAVEKSLEHAPEDLDARLRLLGFYLLAAVASPKAAWLGSQHILWLVQHAPEHPVLGTPLGIPVDEGVCADVGRTWRNHMEASPRNTRILVHAARFFGQMDRPFAEQIRYRLQLIDPPRFAEFALDFPLPGANAAQAEPAEVAGVDHSSGVNVVTPGASGPSRLLQDAIEALQSGDYDHARDCALAALAAAESTEPGRTNGELVHGAQSVLGHLALIDGDRAQACAHLRASTDVSGSPRLETFGPEMSLARALIEAGERDAVLDYLERCRRFWKMGHALLDAWEADLFEGRMPNFLGNLRWQVRVRAAR